MNAFPEQGLYVVTDPLLLPAARLETAVERAIHGGAAAVQYRDKTSPPALRSAQARSLAALCRSRGVAFIVNDDVELALAAGADGVHLGREDPALSAARARLGEEAVIGISCNDSLPRALAAERDGASYVAFGRFFASHTKPGAVPATPALLREARAQLSLTIVAIGGITPENGGSLLAAGADVLAVVHGVFGQQDPQAAARRYGALFD